MLLVEQQKGYLLVFLLSNVLEASENYRPSVLQKRQLYPIAVGVNEFNLCFGKREFQRLLGWADCSAYILSPASNFGLRKKRFPKVTAVSYTLW